jgi:hypothetical protein
MMRGPSRSPRRRSDAASRPRSICSRPLRISFVSRRADLACLEFREAGFARPWTEPSRLGLDGVQGRLKSCPLAVAPEGTNSNGRGGGI